MCKQPYQPLGTMATEVYSTEGLPVDVNNTPPDVLALATVAAGRKPRCDKPIKCPSTGEFCERWTPDEDQRLLEAARQQVVTAERPPERPPERPRTLTRTSTAAGALQPGALPPLDGTRSMTTSMSMPALGAARPQEDDEEGGDFIRGSALWNEL